MTQNVAVIPIAVVRRTKVANPPSSEPGSSAAHARTVTSASAVAATPRPLCFSGITRCGTGSGGGVGGVRCIGSPPVSSPARDNLLTNRRRLDRRRHVPYLAPDPMADPATTSVPASPPRAPDPGASSAQLSPAMRQYQQFKSQYPGYVLFFRMGDF